MRQRGHHRAVNAPYRWTHRQKANMRQRGKKGPCRRMSLVILREFDGLHGNMDFDEGVVRDGISA